MVRRLAWAAGTTAAAACLLLLGEGVAQSLAWALSAAVLISARSERVLSTAGAAALWLAALGGGVEAAALTAAAGLCAGLAAVSFPARAAACISILLAGQSGGVAGYWAFCAASVALLAPVGAGLRRLLVPSVLLGSVLAFGIPERAEPRSTTIQESLSGGGVSWPEACVLDRASQEAVIRIPPGTGGIASIRLEGGGTRDSLPVGLVFGETFAAAIPPGVSTLEIPDGEDFVTFCLSRPYRPFEHPVVIVGPGGLEP